MTSVLNYLDNTSCNPINHLPSSQQNLPLDSTINPETTILVQPPSSNQAKPSPTLLSKRYDAKELGDLLTKKLKTISTNHSDNGSNQHSPTSKKSFGLDTMADTPGADSPQTDESQTIIQEEPMLRIPSFDGHSHSIPLVAQEGLSHFSLDISGDLSPQRMTILESQQRVQQALSELHRRMILEQQAALLQELLLQVPLSQDLLNIPSFLPSLPVVNEAPVNEKKVKNNKKDAKKNEQENMEFTYGSIEFPFLSLSLPLGNEETQKNTGFSLEPAKLPSSLTSISDGDKQAALEMRESLCATRAGTQRSESDMGSSMKDLIEEKKTIKATGAKKKEIKEKINKKIVEAINKEEKALKVKKDKEKLKVKVSEKQGEKEKEKQKDEDLLSELYPARAYFQKKNTERRKNRWQVAQDDKLKSEGIQIPDLKDLLEGGKKKIVETPVGPEHQVEICMLAIKSATNIRRQPKKKWNPETHSQAEMQKFFVSLRNIYRCNVIQEKAIEILMENDNDIKKALEYVKINKAKCLVQLTINADN